MLPVTHAAKGIVIVMIAVLFYIIPRETSKLTELLAQATSYMKPYRAMRADHVVVTGQMSLSTAARFLYEFYHADHGDQVTHVVFLLPEEPSRGWKDLIHNVAFEGRVFYVIGRPSSVSDLKRASVMYAGAAFVFADIAHPDHMASDAAAMLVCKAIRDRNPLLTLYTQLILSENYLHSQWAQWDTSICVEQLRMALVGKACIVPGFSSFICSLMRSADTREAADAGTSALANTVSGFTTSSSQKRSWQQEFGHGYNQEMYCLPISAELINHRFEDIVERLLLLHGILLFGVQTRVTPAKRKLSKV